MQFSHCRLTNQTPGAEIYPRNGDTKVPTNVVIEIQYPKELLFTEKEMNSSLFSVQECQINPFSYLDPTKQGNPASPTQTKKDSTDEQKKDENGNPIPDSNSTISGTAAKKIGSALIFSIRTLTDSSTGRIFNYLVIDPGAEKSPLKSNATYCVTTGGITNAAGVKIGAKEISFATADSNFQFQTRFEEHFFGDTLRPSSADVKNPETEKDWVLIYLDGYPVRPADLKNHVRLCLEVPDQQFLSEDTCKGMPGGKIVDSDIRMLVPLESDQDAHIPARYNLYAVTAHGEMKEGEKYRVILNQDMGKNEDTETGEVYHDFDIVNQDFFGWKKAYADQIRDAAGNSLLAKIQLLFYVGPGSTSTESTASQGITAPSKTTTTPGTNSNTSSANANTQDASSSVKTTVMENTDDAEDTQ